LSPCTLNEIAVQAPDTPPLSAAEPFRDLEKLIVSVASS